MIKRKSWLEELSTNYASFRRELDYIVKDVII